MAAFVLTWNPARWDFAAGEYEDWIAKTRAGVNVDGGWSTGIRSRGIEVGDRAFLLRQHFDRGIVASGTFSSEIWEDEHWDGSGRVTTFADVSWDTALDPAERLPVEVLNREVQAYWDRMQGSGVKLTDHAADRLEEIWADHRRALGLPSR